MHYEERVIDGVLCYRGYPSDEWKPMTAERLTALVLELRQRQAAPPVFVPQPYPVMAPQPVTVPWQPPWTITCGAATTSGRGWLGD